ncbi:MAG: hypothetical protein IJB70_00905 [Clostridia bacterium]|nr:hypothetical protein [Clostridia bacterium]
MLTKEDYIKIMDSVCEIQILLEKIDVLTDDIYVNFFDRFEMDINADFTDYEVKAARVKSDMLRKFTVPTVQKADELWEFLKNLKEENLKE